MHKKRAFTLIELLVVVTIIALLMSILMPALAKARKQALAIADRARERQWGVVFSLYTGENDGFFNSREVGTPAGYARTWDAAFEPFYKDHALLCCPAADNNNIKTGPFATWNLSLGQWRPRGGYYGSYGMNRYIENMGGGDKDNPAFWRRTDVKGGDKVPVILDCQYVNYWSSSTADPPAYNGDYTTPEMHWIAIDRHMGYNNVLLLDFSVRKVGLKELWALKHSRSFNICDMWTICGRKGSKSACVKAWDNAAPWMSSMPEY
jgi:prepilin-type N-terminal cleavage/methylation domain-containing protein